jgi:hypothetical protein
VHPTSWYDMCIGGSVSWRSVYDGSGADVGVYHQLTLKPSGRGGCRCGKRQPGALPGTTARTKDAINPEGVRGRSVIVDHLVLGACNRRPL